MRYPSTFLAHSALVVGLSLTLTGCAPSPSGAPARVPIPVTVSYPVERYVTDYADFTARTAAVDSVEVRARVWGYLDKVNFKEGALVKKGDVLFELDPQTYQATLNQQEALLKQAQAHRASAADTLARDQATPAATPQAMLIQDQGALAEADAAVASARAARESAKLNVTYTKVIAPVSGRVSRYLVTVGNLIQSGDQNGGTLLTTIVSVDPMYAYFDVDERTVQRVGQLAREGASGSAPETAWPVSLGLGTQEGFPHQGTINFVDNQINPKTGTLRARGVFPNKDQSLSPGFFGRVRVPIGQPHLALLVSDRALDNDQGQKILYVVSEKDEVVSRAVRPGALHDGLRAIEDGLKQGERVIVNGLQLVRPGITVEPKLVDMPTSGGQESGVRTPKGPVRVAKTTP
jgi:RND family efflux transporter MFP subunit